MCMTQSRNIKREESNCARPFLIRPYKSHFYANYSLAPFVKMEKSQKKTRPVLLDIENWLEKEPCDILPIEVKSMCSSAPHQASSSYDPDKPAISKCGIMDPERINRGTYASENTVRNFTKGY